MSQRWRTERPKAGEHNPYYAGYVAEAPGDDLVDNLEKQGTEFGAMLREIPESRGGYRYAEGKWSIREVVLHLCDAERVFAYRTLWFARGAPTELPGFDENAWVPMSGAEDRTLADLAAEFQAIRKATIAMVKPLPDEAMSRRGVASGSEVTARALVWIIAGHTAHHARVLKERYL